MRKLKAFTLTEIVVAILVITVVLTATLTITKNKMEKVDKYYYYMAYSIATDISKNVLAQKTFDFPMQLADGSSTNFNKKIRDIFLTKFQLKRIYALNSASIPPSDINSGQVTPDIILSTSADLCGEIKKVYNTSASNCSVSPASYSGAVASGDFSNVTPNIVLNNGLRLFITSNFTEIAKLATDDSTVSEKDKVGFIIYIDSNGEKAGKNRVNSDVFAFYLLRSGKMVPDGGQSAGGRLGGADSTDNLTANVLYDDFAGDNRVVKTLLYGVDYRTAACVSGTVISEMYCTKPNGTVITKNGICNEVSDCRIRINRPMRRLF